MVQILDGICDIPDICRNKHCAYYDTTKEATEHYIDIKAELREEPWDEKLKEKILVFHCPYLAWKNKERLGTTQAGAEIVAK